MRNPWKSKNLLVVITLLFVALSICADLISMSIGIAWGSGGYMRKLNWSLYPIFFIIVGLLVHASWSLYLQAWRSLPANGVLYRNGNKETDESALDRFLDHIRGKRFPLVIASVAFGLILTALDAGCLWMEYGVLSKSAACAESDFSVAFRLPDVFPPVGKTADGLFNLFVYFLQGMLIAYALLALMQVYLHGFYFWRFEHAQLASEEGLSLRLNSDDPLREFGLTEVNRALNTLFITMALGMAIPVLSAAFQQSDIPDLGQWMLRIILPIALIAPLIIPMTDRYIRQKEEKLRVLASRDDTTVEKFINQKLWPFEGTHVGYVGKTAAIIALGEYIYLFTRNFIDILK
jgi:hypothetical protein